MGNNIPAPGSDIPLPGGGGSQTLPSTLNLADTATNTAPDGIIQQHDTSGTSAPGFGLTDAIELESAAGNRRRVMTDVVTLTTATDGAEETRRSIGLMSGGSLLPTAHFSFGNGSGSGAQLALGSSAQNNGLREFEGPNRLDVILGGSAMMTFLAASITDNIRRVVAARFQQSQGATVASANTITLGADGNVFPISGTTTINGITTTTWAAGAVIYLKFAGIVTVTHNSGTPGGGAVAIKTTTAANVTTAANSIMTLVYDGTFWVQTCPITPGY